jgi:hypothetical protein
METTARGITFLFFLFKNKTPIQTPTALAQIAAAYFCAGVQHKR